ncbi:MAG: o-succinylbenzoate synthase [Caldilineaceae bacterium]|nr:o-succinylbenzoate synthase [Caldilineaceae bacterium]
MLQLAATPYTLHFRNPAPTSRGMLTSRTIWFVRAWRSEAPDAIGWGECGPMPGLSRDHAPAFDATVARFCAEFNQAAMTRLEAARRWTSRLVAAWPAFAFGVETALRDLATGSRQQLWDTPFARGEDGLPTHGLIWMDDVDGALRQVEAKVAAGFSVIKMKIGALPFAEELALLRAVCAAFPAIDLRLDANGAFTPEVALDRLESLAQFGVRLVEQPVAPGQWDVLAALCRHSPVPVALDEELIPLDTPAARTALLAAVRPQYLILKPMLLGGIAASEAWIAEARERNIGWIINSLLESAIGLNAICQWTSAVGAGQVHGLGTGALFTNNLQSPLRLQGHLLQYDPAVAWQFPPLARPQERD